MTAIVIKAIRHSMINMMIAMTSMNKKLRIRLTIVLVNISEILPGSLVARVTSFPTGN